jgi:hypothetical protein
MRLDLKATSAQRGREAAAPAACGRVTSKRAAKETIDTSRRWCRCPISWNGGEGHCNYCGKSIQGQA